MSRWDILRLFWAEKLLYWAMLIIPISPQGTKLATFLRDYAKREMRLITGTKEDP